MDKIVMPLMLWLAIYIVSAPQRKAFKDFAGGIYKTYKRRRLLKRNVKIYNRLCSSANSDYLRGFYYGKAGQLKGELSEVKYFE